MDENLESFVSLLNRQRQKPPVPKELSGLPGWAQRELIKRPDPAAKQTVPPTNGKAHNDKPASEIIVEAGRAPLPTIEAAPVSKLETAPPKIELTALAKVEAPQPLSADTPQPATEAEAAPPKIEPPVPQPTAEVLPPLAKVEKPAPSKPAAKAIDPQRDPEGWLARFLAEEAAPRAKAPLPDVPAPAAENKIEAKGDIPAPEAAKKNEPIAPEKIAAEKPADAKPAEKKDEPPLAAADEEQTDPAPALTEAAEIVSMLPVVVETLASPRAARRPLAYALAAAAVIAVVALVVGAYWYMRSETEVAVDIKTNVPASGPGKPAPSMLASTTSKPAAPDKKLAATKPTAPPPSVAATKPADKPKPETKVAAAPVPPSIPPLAPKPAPAPTVAAKPETPTVTAKPAPIVAAKPAPAAPRSSPAMVAQKVSDKPQPQPAEKPAAPAVVAAPKPAPAPSAPPTQVAMLPGATPTANPAVPATPVPSKGTPAAAAPALAIPAPAKGAPGGAAVASGDEPTWQRNATPAPPFSGKPQIAIVIDDLGLDRNRTERAIALDGPVTLSFLAYASDLPRQTAAARQAGHELIVHVPMEPIMQPKYVSQASSGSPSPARTELLRRLRWDLSRFTGYVGVNNHMGNRLASDPDSTRTVIAELKVRGLLFLDSRLVGSAVLDDAAREGVPTVTRDVLLDDDITASSVSDRLAQLEQIARHRGTAIAIGHPHDQTLDALKVWIASLPSKGLQLVPLTAIVKDREQHVAGVD